MDSQELQDLKRRALAAREFSVSVGPADAQRHITLRVPTQHETNLAARRCGVFDLSDDKAATLVMQRSLLQQAIVGWSGVVVGDILSGDPATAEVLPYGADFVLLLLDANTDWERVLAGALMERMAKRRAEKDTAEKN